MLAISAEAAMLHGVEGGGVVRIKGAKSPKVGPGKPKKMTPEEREIQAAVEAGGDESKIREALKRRKESII